MSRSQKTYCCVSSCKNSNKSNLTLFTLPTDEERRKQWLTLAGREDLINLQTNIKNRYICEQHFAPYAIKQTYQRKLLNPYALPTLRLPGNSYNEVICERPSNFVRNVTTQTPVNQFWHMKLEADILSYKRNKKTSKQALSSSIRVVLENEGNKVLSPALVELLKCDEKLNSSRVALDKEDRYREYCLGLYYGCTQGYRLLQNALSLPHPSILFKQLPISTTINLKLLRALRSKFEQMNLEEFESVLVVDSMPLTPQLNYDVKTDRIVGFHEVNGNQMPLVAERALVLMIHGMLTQWKQVAGYALLSSAGGTNVAHWLNELINKICSSGLETRVLCFASKVEADFFETRWVTNSTPFFYIKKSKIYCLSDPKMLLKALRSDWSLYNIRYNGNQIAKFEHVKEFYNRDKNNQYRFAPKLTNDHIYLTKPDCDNISELFSKAVVSGISAYIDNGDIDASARDTVEFINVISDLFLFFNTPNDLTKQTTNSVNKTFVDKSSLMKYITKMKNFFLQIELLDSHGKNVTQLPTFTRGFLLNISTYSCLLDEKECTQGFKVPLGTIHQGVTEKLFEQIRSKANNLKPTPIQFEEHFRQLFISDAIKPLKKRDTKHYHGNFFMIAKKMSLRQAAAETSTVSSGLVPKQASLNVDKIVFSDLDYNHIDRSERHSLIYVSGYLLKKCKEHHSNCEVFNNYSDRNNELITVHHISRYHNYSLKNQISLMAVPCNHFVIIIEKYEEAFRRAFRKNYTSDNLVSKLYDTLSLVDVTMPPCPCFPWQFLIKLFIRLRIAYTVQLNNREIERNNQNHFVIPLLLSEF